MLKPARLWGAPARLSREKPPFSADGFQGGGTTLPGDSPDDAFAYDLAAAGSALPQDWLPPGNRLAPYLDLHHDGTAQAVRCGPAQTGSVSFDCGAFGGSYLSLAAAIPEHLTARFGPGRVLTFRVAVDASRPLAAFLRLNIGSADGHEVFHETLVVHRGERAGSFDMDGVRLPFDCRLHAWVDVILSRPQGSEIRVSQMTLSLLGKDQL